jgi:protein phosphatase
VREDNQDTILTVSAPGPEGAPGPMLAALADGMGGYSLGGLASQVTVEAFRLVCEAAGPDLSLKTFKSGFEQANVRVLRETERQRAGRMGATLTAAAVAGRKLLTGHIGDSRLYLVRGRKASLLTTDHSQVGELVRMKALSPDKVRTHARRSILTRSIGMALIAQPDFSEHTLQEGDRLILACDGVWAMIQDEEFGEIGAATGSPHHLSQELVDLAIERGTDDNVSVVSVFIHRLAEQPASSAARRPFALGAIVRSLLSLNKII